MMWEPVGGPKEKNAWYERDCHMWLDSKTLRALDGGQAGDQQSWYRNQLSLVISFGHAVPENDSEPLCSY